MMEIRPEELAILFHDTYERLAPEYGYETRKDTRDFDPNTPNGKLMIAVCGHILSDLKKIEEEVQREEMGRSHIAELLDASK